MVWFGYEPWTNDNFWFLLLDFLALLLPDLLALRLLLLPDLLDFFETLLLPLLLLLKLFRLRLL